MINKISLIVIIYNIYKKPTFNIIVNNLYNII